MNQDIKFKKTAKWLFTGPIVLCLVAALLSLGMFFWDFWAGLGCLCLSLILGGFQCILYIRGKESIRNEIYHLDGFFRRMERSLLEDLHIPYAVLETDGRILWMNRSFRDLTGKEEYYHKSVAGIFPSLTKEFLGKVGTDARMIVDYSKKSYRIIIHKEHIPKYMGESLETVGEEGGLAKDVLSILLIDASRQIMFEEMYRKEKMSVALIYIDNFDEVTEHMEEVKASLLRALVDRKVSRYFTGDNAIVKRFDEDKYLVIFKQENLKAYKENKFSLLETMKDVQVGNDMDVILSIGIGAMAESYKTNYEDARAALDLALGRGGDQVVVKENDDISYFGGSTRQVDRSTRVKARVKARALFEVMSQCDNVLIMGHHIGDVDSFGASIGIYRAATTIGKRAQIVIDEITSSIRPMKEKFTPEYDYPTDMFLDPQEAIELVTPNTMVMVVDVNRPSYTECPKLLEPGKTVVVFDHHRHGSDTIKGAALSYIEPYASSTCEMVTEVLQYFSEDLKITLHEADCIYAGIIIDTNNFMTKTGVRTFEAAAYLRRSGADVTRVRKMLQNDMDSYKARAETVRDAEVYRGVFAISHFPAARVESPTVAGAQAANELLNIIGIKASFVLTAFQNRIYISSRSIDEIDVQAIMARLGGGGHVNVAGAQMEDTTTAEATLKIKETLDQMIEDGEIKI